MLPKKEKKKGTLIGREQSFQGAVIGKTASFSSTVLFFFFSVAEICDDWIELQIANLNTDILKFCYRG